MSNSNNINNHPLFGGLKAANTMKIGEDIKKEKPMEQWRPIETAPKDGTAILLGSRGGSWVGKWLPVYTSGYRPDNPWSSVMLNHDHMAEKRCKPTHWMLLPSTPGAEQAKPVQAMSEPERWSAYFEGAERVTVSDSEGEAVGEMQFQIDNDSEPGDEIEFCVAPMVSATQMLRKFGAKWIGEDVFERINERLSDEMGAEDCPLDLPKDEQEKLGQQVIEFVCQHAKCQWWTIDSKREQKRTYVAGSNDEPGHCPTCGEEDGGTTCGMPDCGLRCGGITKEGA